MKITAIYNVQVTGHGIVKRGETIDLRDDEIDERIAANFTKADGSPLGASQVEAKKERKEQTQDDADAAKIARTVEVIGRDGLMVKLDELGITYSPKHKTDYLARLLLTAQGEIDAR